MGGSGSTVLDLGPFPGVSDAEFTITGLTGIADASKVEAWIQPADTTAGFGADGAPFNGNVYLTRGANLSGIADSKVGILSCWFLTQWQFFLNEASFTHYQLYGKPAATTGQLVLQRFETYSGLTVYGAGGADANLNSVTYQGELRAQWNHFFASWDIGNNVGAAYMNDVLIDNTPSRVADEVAAFSTNTNWSVGSDNLGNNKYVGTLAELYFNSAAYLDPTSAANRRKFNQILQGGNLVPVSLGTTGSLPTGTTPILYMHLDNGEVASNFKLNRGTGGDFSWNDIANVPSYGLPLVQQPSHSQEEHILDAPDVVAYSPSAAGASMKVRLSSRQTLVQKDSDYPDIAAYTPPTTGAPLIAGKWNIGWVWI